MAPRTLIAALVGASALAGFVHAGAAAAHRDAGGTHVVFFVLVGTAQLVWAAVVATRPGRAVLLAGAAGNIVVAGVWALTRLFGEPLGSADVLATVCELAIAVGSWRVAAGQEVLPVLAGGRPWAPAGSAVVLLATALVAAPALGTSVGGHHDDHHGGGNHAHEGAHGHKDGAAHAHGDDDHADAAHHHDGGSAHAHTAAHDPTHNTAHDGPATAHAHAFGTPHAHDPGAAHAAPGHDHGTTHEDHGTGAGHEHAEEATPPESEPGLRYEPASDGRGAALIADGWSQEASHHNDTDTACRPTPSQQAAADRLAAATRAELGKYDGDPARAMRDGFVPLPIPSDRQVHMLNLRRISHPTILEASQIESFLYAMTDRGLVVIGGMYMMPDREAQGPEFGGCLTRWHRHTGMSGRLLTAGQSDRTAEMLHVWTYPGLDPYGEYDGREVSQLWAPGAAIPSVCTDAACF